MTALTVTNPGFETAPSGIVSNWPMTVNNGNSALVIRSTTPARTGSNSARISSSSGNMFGNFQQECQSDLISLGAAVAGDTVSVSGYAATADTHTDRHCAIGIEFYNSLNVSLGARTYGAEITPYADAGNVVNSFVQMTHSAVVPATATQIRIHLYNRKSSAGDQTNSLRMDDITASFSAGTLPDPTTPKSFTPQTAGLVVLSKSATSPLDGQGGPRTSQLTSLAVIDQSTPADVVSSPQLSGLVVFEYGPDSDIDTGGPATSQFAGLVVWGQNVREQLNIRSWGFELDGHVFVVYSFGAQGTFVWDDLTGTWSKWYTQGFGNHLNAENGIYWYDGRYVAASIQDPTVVEMNFDSQLDDGFRTIQRVVTGLVTLKHRDQTLDVGALHIDASTGAPSYVGPNPPGPRMRLRYSDDEGNTWSDYEDVALTVGDFQQDIQWRSLGTIFAPGRIFEISDEGGVVRIDGAWMDTYGDDNGGTR